MTLTKNGYLPRLVDNEIRDHLSAMGAVCIEGPKWCGKTWTALNHANSTFDLSDPTRNFQNKTLAETEVESALRGDSPHHIDEWQEVPRIWDALRTEVDKGHQKGRFILTGSSTPERKGVMHSGTGRIGTIRMHTMSLLESSDSSGVASISSLFRQDMKTVTVKDVDLRQLIDLTVRGGWPEALTMSVDGAMLLLRSYLNSIRDEDFTKIDGVSRDGDKIRRCINSLSRNESTVVSNKTIIRDIKEYDDDVIDDDTLSDYLKILKRMFITEDQFAFNPGLRSSYRVGKSPKRHLADPSLSIAAIEATPESLFDDLETYGFMFESMCERDLRIYAQCLRGRVGHYRDGRGNEIDAIIELANGHWGAFEIKLGMNQVDEAAEKLLKMNEKFQDSRRPPDFLCVLVGLSSYAYRREDGVYVVPITALGP